MSGQSDATGEDGIEQALAELDHIEGRFAEFAIINRKSRESERGVYPYIRASELPDGTEPGDLFEIRYDSETEEIASLNYSESETEVQNRRNAEKLAEIKEDDVVQSDG